MFTETITDQSDLLLSNCVKFVSLNGGGICDISPFTVKWLNQSVRSLLTFSGDLAVSKLSPVILDDWHKNNLTRLTITSANGYLRGIKVIYSRLMARGVIIYNPAKFVSFAPEPVKRPRAMSEATYNALRAVADARDLAIVDLLWASGCRRGGLVTMSLNTLDNWTSANGEECLAVQVTEKLGKSRYIYASGVNARSVLEWLKIRPFCNHSALFVTSSGTPLKKTAVSSIMRKLRIAANIPAGVPANAHSMRHAFAIRMLDRGVDLATVAAWLGHSDPITTAKFYAVRREDQLRSRYFDLKS